MTELRNRSEAGQGQQDLEFVEKCKRLESAVVDELVYAVALMLATASKIAYRFGINEGQFLAAAQFLYQAEAARREAEREAEEARAEEGSK